jgi:GT2 family glycosyltransferase
MSLTPLYVVTLNWNLKEDTIACVESVLAAGVPPEQTVIVDNGSTDDSVETFAARFSTLHLVCNEQNLGFGGGMNAGIAYALCQGAGSVLILNNDTVIHPTMIETLLTTEQAIHEPGVLGPAIYYDDGGDRSRLWRLGDRRHRWLPMPLPVKRSPRSLPTAVPFQVDYVTGCGMLVRRQVFERIGLFDTRYFMYFEDADFCRRAQDAGFTVWCVPQARMWHKVSQTAQRDKPFNRYHRARNQVRFYHEHPHGPFAILREGYIAVKLAKTMLGDIWHRDWDLIGPTCKGTIDGYREERM